MRRLLRRRERRAPVSSVLLQRRVDDCEMARSRDEPDVGDTEDTLQLACGNNHGTGVRGVAGRGLRKGGGCCGVEGDVSFDLLYGLVDVAVEDGDRAEALEIGEGLCT